MLERVEKLERSLSTLLEKETEREMQSGEEKEREVECNGKACLPESNRGSI
jgi:hypothetical protein